MITRISSDLHDSNTNQAAILCFCDEKVGILSTDVCVYRKSKMAAIYCK